MNTSSPDIIVRLREECLFRGILWQDVSEVVIPEYHLVYACLYFLPDRTPPELFLPCRFDRLKTLEGKATIRRYQSTVIHEHTREWEYIYIALDGSIEEAELISLIHETEQIYQLHQSQHRTHLLRLAQARLPIRNALDNLIDLHRLAHKRSEIHGLLQPSIIMQTHPTEEQYIAIGQSKIGGLPDLPKHCVMPQIAGVPLAFLAQINLLDLTASIPQSPLPERGMLYFFSGNGWVEEDNTRLDTSLWLSFDHPDFSRVLYFDEPPDVLERRPKPPGIKSLNVAAIHFIEVMSLPRSAYFSRDPILQNFVWTDEDFDHLDNLSLDFMTFTGAYFSFYAWHKLFGYADVIQGPVTQGTSRLLCQIDSDYDQDPLMQWGDGGTIYFVIEDEELKRRDFSRVKCELQSS